MRWGTVMADCQTSATKKKNARLKHLPSEGDVQQRHTDAGLVSAPGCLAGFRQHNRPVTSG